MKAKSFVLFCAYGVFLFSIVAASALGTELAKMRFLGREGRWPWLREQWVVVETNAAGGKLELQCDLVKENTRIAWRGPEDTGNVLPRVVLVASDDTQWPGELWTIWTGAMEAYNFTFSSDGTNTALAFLEGGWFIFVPRIRITRWDTALEKQLKNPPYGQDLPEDQRPCEAVFVFKYFSAEHFDNTVHARRDNMRIRKLWWDKV